VKNDAGAGCEIKCPAGIPDNWIEKSSKTGGGKRYIDPGSIRI